MASFTSNSLQQKHHHHHHLLHSITTLCKYPSPLNVFEYHCPSHFFTFSPPKQTLQLKHTLKLYPLPLARGNINHIVAKSGSGTQTLDTVDSFGEETVELSRARDSESGNWDDTSGSDESAEKMEVSSGNRFDNDVDGASNEKRNLAWFSNGFVKQNSRLLDGLNNPTKVGDDGTGLEDPCSGPSRFQIKIVSLHIGSVRFRRASKTLFSRNHDFGRFQALPLRFRFGSGKREWPNASVLSSLLLLSLPGPVPARGMQLSGGNPLGDADCSFAENPSSGRHSRRA